MIARLTRFFVPFVLLVAVTLGACGSGSSSGGGRPTTPVRIQILEPTPNQVTGPDVTVRVDVIGGRVVAQTTGKLTPDEGHVHLLVDGQIVSMAYTTSQQIHVSPGPHQLQAEWVATDHRPFANRVVAGVLFQAQA